ncbi:MAG: lactate utilization protein [Clostridia bacterium]|nr:lactate utilization protein [Clostridia bacterium]
MKRYFDEVTEQRIERTKAALEANRMMVYRARTADEAREIVKGLLKDGDSIGVGGSATLDECDILTLIRSPEYRFIDRYEAGLSGAQVHDRHVQALGADVYITGSNAVTEDGLLYNVDGRGNRIAAIAFGPESVIVIVGANKIVRNLEEAVIRVKSVAAPANCKRLSCDTHCAKKGRCCTLTDPWKDSEIGAGCHSEGRICCDYLISGYQRIPDRIKVIIVDQELGF